MDDDDDDDDDDDILSTAFVYKRKPILSFSFLVSFLVLVLVSDDDDVAWLGCVCVWF
jgi:hypothetical protein